MHILGKALIEDFKREHSTSRKALDRWVKLMEAADFSGPQDLKRMFGANVDFVGKQIVFDVGGNKIRTITKITFGQKLVLITHVLTHAEYDKSKWKD